MIEINTMDLSLENVRKLNRQYATVESKTKLTKSLNSIFDCDFDFRKSPISIHEVYNHILTNHYPNETAIKSTFLNNVLFNRKNHVTIFELPVMNSRTDLCTINGESVVYEIKTEFDNFNRIEKQISDYNMIFDKCYVICPKRKIEAISKHIPAETGIYSYRITKSGRYIYKLEKPATKNTELLPLEQLKVLRKPELNHLLSKAPSDLLLDKKEFIEKLLETHTGEQINRLFKNALKARYKKQWSFLKDNQDVIQEIDYQWFFKSPIDPGIVYN